MLMPISLKPAYAASTVVMFLSPLSALNTPASRSSAKSISPRFSAWAIESWLLKTRKTRWSMWVGGPQ